VRRVIRRSLLELGYSVLEADGGADALNLLEHTPGIALLLSDVVMAGGVDGLAVARAARAGGRAGAVVLMSGYAPGDLSRQVDFPMLSKPFSTEQLAQAIEEGR
jgi:CheY-like chemotaxis protein